MNQRFKELLKQSTNPPWDGEQGPMNEFNLERFAELIVRECIERVCNQYTPIRDCTIQGRPNHFYPELRVRTECGQAIIESGIKSIMALEELIQDATDRWHKENILGDEA